MPLSFSQPHLWLMNCERVGADQVDLWGSVLSEDERDSAFARTRDEDKVSYLAAHFLLRNQLSRITGLAAKSFRFAMNTLGKPILLSFPHFHFNISHTDGFAAVAIALQEVGVDIERSNAFAGKDELISYALHPREIAFLSSCPVAERLKAAAKIWTAKEAFAKALGKGLSLPFAQFHVEVSPPRILGGGKHNSAALWIGENFSDCVVSLCLMGGLRHDLAPVVHAWNADDFVPIAA